MEELLEAPMEVFAEEVFPQMVVNSQQTAAFPVNSQQSGADSFNPNTIHWTQSQDSEIYKNPFERYETSIVSQSEQSEDEEDVDGTFGNVEVPMQETFE